MRSLRGRELRTISAVDISSGVVNRCSPSFARQSVAGTRQDQLAAPEHEAECRRLHAPRARTPQPDTGNVQPAANRPLALAAVSPPDPRDRSAPANRAATLDHRSQSIRDRTRVREVSRRRSPACTSSARSHEPSANRRPRLRPRHQRHRMVDQAPVRTHPTPVRWRAARPASAAVWVSAKRV